MRDLIRVAVASGAERVAIVTLSDSDRRNAISQSMSDELVEAFEQIESDPDIGAVIVTGDGSSFCAGADLGYLGGSPSEEALRGIYRAFLRVASSPLPTVAAVNGPAVGAGMNLALSCDLRIAGSSAHFDTRFLKLGIHPGGGHTWLMQRLVGPQATLAAVLFGESMDGSEAERRGLAWRCVPDDLLLPAAISLAARAAATSPSLVRRTKETIVAAADAATLDEAVALELSSQLWSMDRPEFKERLADLHRRISKNS